MTAAHLVVLLVLDEGASGGDERSCMELRLSLIKQTADLSLCREICEHANASNGLYQKRSTWLILAIPPMFEAGQVADKIVRAQASPPPIATCIATTNSFTSSVKVA